MNTSIAVLLLFVGSTGAGDGVVRSIVENGHKKVGVIPTVINRRGDREATIGSLGPRGKVMANELYEKLISASQRGRYKGKYKVVPERIMRRALKSRTLEDLSKPRKLQELARDVGGVDSFIIATIDEDGSVFSVDTLNANRDKGNEQDKDGEGTKKKRRKILTYKGSTETIDPNDGVVTDKVPFLDNLTLSKAAYMGESWEIRQWKGDVLDNVGIDLEGEDAFGRGSNWERSQYVKLNADVKHPQEDTTFLYPVTIKVDGQIREPHAIGDKYVVELNAGEEYSVFLRNDSDQDVYVALYIDGLNSINQEQIEPDQLKTRLHWRLNKGKGNREIRGWYKIEYDEEGKTTDMQSYKRFTVVDRAESVAAGQGFEDSIGMVTAIFYTVGMKNIDEPEGKPTRGLPDSIVGTGEGEEVEQELSMIKGDKRGLMLAAWTFYYRTKEQIEEIQSGDPDDVINWGDESYDYEEKDDNNKDIDKDDDRKDEDDENKNEDDDGEELEIIEFK